MCVCSCVYICACVWACVSMYTSKHVCVYMCCCVVCMPLCVCAYVCIVSLKCVSLHWNTAPTSRCHPERVSVDAKAPWAPLTKKDNLSPWHIWVRQCPTSVRHGQKYLATRDNSTLQRVECLSDCRLEIQTWTYHVAGKPKLENWVRFMSQVTGSPGPLVLESIKEQQSNLS